MKSRAHELIFPLFIECRYKIRDRDVVERSGRSFERK